MKINLLITVITILFPIITFCQEKSDYSTGGVGYTYISKYSKGGLYGYFLMPNGEKSGYYSNLDMFFIGNYTVSFLDINYAYLLTNTDIKIYPYAGIACGFVSDGYSNNPEYDFADIDAFKVGLSVGFGGTYCFNKISITCNYGYNSIIKAGLIRFGIGLKI